MCYLNCSFESITTRKYFTESGLFIGQEFKEILIDVDSKLRREAKSFTLAFGGVSVKLFLFIQSETFSIVG